MSMLSAQCDKMRAMAESVGLAMPQAATLMMGAADTIWELRCKLVDAECRVRKLGELCKLCAREVENAKLRELVRDMAECMDNSQPRCKKCKFRELNCQWFKFDDRMRELGVEVE